MELAEKIQKYQYSKSVLIKYILESCLRHNMCLSSGTSVAKFGTRSFSAGKLSSNIHVFNSSFQFDFGLSVHTEFHLLRSAGLEPFCERRGRRAGSSFQGSTFLLQDEPHGTAPAAPGAPGQLRCIALNNIAGWEFFSPQLEWQMLNQIWSIILAPFR